MAGSTGKRRASKHSSGRSGRARIGPLHLAGTAVAVLACVVAWVYLVGATIDFGGFATRGHPVAWLVVAGACLGAVVSMLLVIVLVARALRAAGLIRDYRPRRAARGAPQQPSPDPVPADAATAEGTSAA